MSQPAPARLAAVPPRQTRVVIVGGGIVGCSLAYHLTRLGCREVVVLEQNLLGGGTTWHAAGLVGRLRTSNSLTRINKYSAELYARLEAETGHPVGWKQVGSLILGKSPERMIQLRRTVAMAEWFGVEATILPPEEAFGRWPLIRRDDILGAAWLPHDGKCIPAEVCRALAKGAVAGGATVLEGWRVSEVLTRDGRATGVRVNSNPGAAAVRRQRSTTRGEAGSEGWQAPLPVEAGVEFEIEAETVVLCGGMWTRELGLRCGVTIPLFPVEHHYLVTEPIEGAFDELPVGRDPDLCLYFRGEGQGVMLGAFQAESKPWNVPSVPPGFSFELLPEDWEKFSEPLRNGRHRIPALERCRFARFVNGPESFTPDNQFILGEAPELSRLFVAAGFNSVGIASAGGAGKYLADWILSGDPGLDLWSVDIRRFGPWANSREYLRSRVVEVLGLHYQMAWPNREPETARDMRLSPLHDRLREAGASFGVKNGWERPNWFAGPGGRTEVSYGFGRQNWFDRHAAEHQACRQRVALFDQSGFGKLRVQGRDAAALLERLCGNRVGVAPGRVVYTGLFNERGGFESDLTVVRTGHEEFLLVTGTAQPGRDLDWIRRHLRPEEQVEVFDVTGQSAVLGLMGPQAREVLARVTDADISPEGFPFGTARRISVGSATALAVRLTYVGELGWELHVPVEQAVGAYQALMQAGETVGMANAGHYAINSLRLEKGYRAWGAELSPDDTPLEAGLSFAIDWTKDFVGRPALERQKVAGVRRRLGIFVLDDPEPVLWGSEIILRDGRTVGYTTSGSYGHSVGGGIAMGYVNGPLPVTADYLQSGRYEINVNGQRIPARLFLKAPYDPERRRILC